MDSKKKKKVERRVKSWKTHRQAQAQGHHPLFLLPPPSPMSQNVFFLSCIFGSLTSQVKQWEEQGWDPLGLLPKVLSLLAKPDPGLGGVSTLDMLGLSPHPPSSAHLTAPSLP